MGKKAVFPGHDPRDQQQMLVEHPEIIVDIPPVFWKKLTGPDNFFRQDIGNGGVGIKKRPVRAEDVHAKGGKGGGEQKYRAAKKPFLHGGSWHDSHCALWVRSRQEENRATPSGRFRGNRHRPSPALAAASRPLKKYLPQAGSSRNNTKNSPTLSRGISRQPKACRTKNSLGRTRPRANTSGCGAMAVSPTKTPIFVSFSRNCHCHCAPSTV